jgi:hypothetical protein
MVRWAWCIAFALLLAGSAFAQSQESGVGSRESGNQPLHERIDALIEAAAIGPLSPPCSDADFVRRVYLDLTGVIPSAEQARAFLADTAADKRAKLIDELLASPAFARHMTLTQDVMLLERRNDKTALAKPWLAYLYESVAADKPLDQLFREMLASDGADEQLRPAARFILGRDAEPNLVTRDIGRIAFGMDMQCCQCHDHPLIDDYYQHDYYGLYAFVHRTSLFTDAKTKQVQLTEKADGEASYKSVFTGDSSDRTTPQLPKGAVLFVEPTFAKGQEYTVKPEKTVRGVPKFSRRQALAEMVAGSTEFRRNLANRIWAMVFGRGIVHPVDFHYAANPPANPQLLTLLADELAAGGFQLRPLLRELVLTRAYQRSCDAPRPEIVNFADIAARLERLTKDKEAATQSVQPLVEAIRLAKADFKAAQDQNATIAAEQPKLEKALADAKAAMDKATAEVKAAEDAVAKAREQAGIVAEASAKAAEAVAKLPEDKVLAEAAGKIAARAAELNSAAEVAQKTAVERTSQQDAAAKQVAAAEDAVQKLAASKVAPEKLAELQRAALTAGRKLADANYAVAAIDSQMATAKAVIEYAALAKSDPVKADAAWAALVERWTIAGQIAPLKPLSPEQMAASALQATGMLKGHEASAVAAVEKTPPEPLKTAADAEKPRIKAGFVELRLIDQLDNTVNEFVKQYGGLPGQDFQATVNQALFFGNGTIIDAWLKPERENLIARLGKMEDTAAIADELYVSIFSRPATGAEKQQVAAYLLDRSDRPVALGEMAWALLSSSEFRFNH